MAKIKGTGGIGQWDTGTANQDIRASIPRSPSNTTTTINWNPKPIAPGQPGYVPLRTTGRKKPRNKGRTASRSKRK